MMFSEFVASLDFGAALYWLVAEILWSTVTVCSVELCWGRPVLHGIDDRRCESLWRLPCSAEDVAFLIVFSCVGTSTVNLTFRTVTDSVV